ncbi:hypothetical protein [Legionella fallonii]|uniref:Uncharacterized protein n=1 Tax=Legionella fallonii LLAP-10 TaxID=1212491 RepID=A0A098G277_9GAMM|nr:hypothetical protein [Legionella fallonii]CEG56578.1 protein of unknown function [Legionella fallonii LLAP-10]
MAAGVHEELIYKDLASGKREDRSLAGVASARVRGRKGGRLYKMIQPILFFCAIGGCHPERGEGSPAKRIVALCHIQEILHRKHPLDAQAF